MVSCSAPNETSIEYSWTAAQKSYGFEVSVDSGQNWITPSSGAMGTSHLVSGLNPGQKLELWVREIDDAPCNYSDIGTAICTADTCDNLQPTIVADSTLCEGETLNLRLEGLSGTNYGVSLRSDQLVQRHQLLLSTDRRYQSYYICRGFVQPCLRGLEQKHECNSNSAPFVYLG